MQEINEKFRSGHYKIPVKIINDGARLYFEFGYNKDLIDEIKVMEGSRYHGYDKLRPRKIWSVANSPGNQFRIDFLAGRNPYARYEKPPVEIKPTRSLYRNQKELVSNGLTTHYGIWAAEMGLGKSLAAIELMELSKLIDWIWVGPNSALKAVKLEFKKWKSKVQPFFINYEGLKKLLENWPKGLPPPRGLIADEASRCKNYTAQRTQAVQHLADSIREAWGDAGYVILMSGSPAPKSPADWWSLCEIACPGFLREGRFDKFKERLSLIRKVEGDYGAYPQLVTWWDDEKKCGFCGEYEDHFVHQTENISMEGWHAWQPSINEVAKLYKRMKGLVTVQFKKDCLDLPEKRYRIVFCPPTIDTINGARLVVARADSAIKTLTHLRELSDGFQYKKMETGKEVCWACNGNRTRKEIIYKGPMLTEEEMLELGIFTVEQHPQATDHPEWFEENIQACSICSGTGSIPSYSREVIYVPCPKEQALKDILDEHEEIGRLVVYAGFTGSVDLCERICKDEGWETIRVDGRGWKCTHDFQDPSQMLEEFQEKKVAPKLAFIGQPGAAGMGLTLTASPTIVYYSNDFNAESRVQSEDRVHRIGMDVNRGATIIDLIHLPSDKLVLDNLQKKRELQSMTMGELKRELDSVTIASESR